jgi:pimeloyl-ACP methyl ester carboxylesterase
VGWLDEAAATVRVLAPGDDAPRTVRLRPPPPAPATKGPATNAPATAAPARIAGSPAATPALDLGDPAGDGHARVSLHLPAGDAEPVATVLSIFPRLHRPGTSHHGRRPVPPVENLGWLTRLDVAVVTLDLSLRWWPELPDEQIRPWIADAVREAVTAGRLSRYVDLRRLAVAGHSFGATLALLALADTDLFFAGLVSSGAYCRSLTPLGFQYERRTLWEAGRVYRDFDAIASAPGIRRPTLILHGTEDRNPATPVDQAVLLFQSLTALGTPSRLVLLPGEGHHIGTREGLTATLTEQVGWLHRWADAAWTPATGAGLARTAG